MAPRYTVNHTYTPTEREAHAIVNLLPGYRDVLCKFLYLNDPENLEEPPLEFWTDLRASIVCGIMDGGLGVMESTMLPPSLEMGLEDPLNLTSACALATNDRRLPQFIQADLTRSGSSRITINASTCSSTVAIQPIQQVAETSYSVVPSVYIDTEPLHILAREWATRLHLSLTNVDHQVPRSATVNLNKFVTYRSSSSSSPIACTDVLVLKNDNLSSVPGMAQRVQPQFLVTHMGPFHRTGFASVVQVMNGASEDGPQTYMGRHSFRLKPTVGDQWKPEVGDRLPQGEWAALPTEIQHDLINSIVGARDDFSKKFCARAYLRKIGQVVDPTSVRALYERDSSHAERILLYENIDIVHAISRALNRGQETLYLYYLRYDGYDKAFTTAYNLCEISGNGQRG